MQGNSFKLRAANSADLGPIFALIRQFVDEEAVVLPIDNNTVLNQLSSFAVGEVNDELVACAKLTNYSPSVELAKFCVNKDYQGRGYSKALAEYLIKQAKDQGFKEMFALSIESKMWDFFKRLGFEEIDRSKLPKSKLADYDLERPSRAFRLQLDT